MLKKTIRPFVVLAMVMCSSPVLAGSLPPVEPVADADGPYSFNYAGMPPEITLDGSGSFHPDGDPLLYEWSWTGGSIPGTSGRKPMVTLPQIGLTSTTDSKTLTLKVTSPDGLSDKDFTSVFYSNEAPTVTSASGTEQADLSMAFAAVFNDMDLGVGITNFEMVMAEIATSSIFGADTLFSASANSTSAVSFDVTGTFTRVQLESQFGVGTHTVYANIKDLAGATASRSFEICVSRDQQSQDCATVPEPTTTALLALGLLGAGYARRRRAH